MTIKNITPIIISKVIGVTENAVTSSILDSFELAIVKNEQELNTNNTIILKILTHYLLLNHSNYGAS